jgi:hypothetical protein
MKNHSLHFIAVAIVVTIAPLAAQNTSAASADKPIPRAADGKPDLSGVWQALGVSLTGETPAPPARGGTPGGAGRGAGGAGRGPREAPPYKPELVAKVRELVADPANSPSARCMLLGVPAITMNPMPIEIVQTPKKTVILYEVMRAFRIIPSDGRDHPKDLDPTYMGDSVAHWDGDTFVVDVTGFNDKTWLDGAGHFHSDALHVVERYTRTPQDTIHYEVTAEDPNVLTKPWKVVDAQLRHPPREDRIMEYECDNNIDLSHIVKPGSR